MERLRGGSGGRWSPTVHPSRLGEHGERSGWAAGGAEVAGGCGGRCRGNWPQGYRRWGGALLRMLGVLATEVLGSLETGTPRGAGTQETGWWLQGHRLLGVQQLGWGGAGCRAAGSTGCRDAGTWGCSTQGSGVRSMQSLVCRGQEHPGRQCPRCRQPGDAAAPGMGETVPGGAGCQDPGDAGLGVWRYLGYSTTRADAWGGSPRDVGNPSGWQKCMSPPMLTASSCPPSLGGSHPSAGQCQPVCWHLPLLTNASSLSHGPCQG